MEKEVCDSCVSWETNERIMRTYGEGMGYCDVCRDVKSCTHTACIAHTARKTHRETQQEKE